MRGLGVQRLAVGVVPIAILLAATTPASQAGCYDASLDGVRVGVRCGVSPTGERRLQVVNPAGKHAKGGDSLFRKAI